MRPPALLPGDRVIVVHFAAIALGIFFPPNEYARPVLPPTAALTAPPSADASAP